MPTKNMTQVHDLKTAITVPHVSTTKTNMRKLHLGNNPSEIHDTESIMIFELQRTILGACSHAAAKGQSADPQLVGPSKSIRVKTATFPRPENWQNFLSGQSRAGRRPGWCLSHVYRVGCTALRSIPSCSSRPAPGDLR